MEATVKVGKHKLDFLAGLAYLLYKNLIVV